MNNGTDQKLSRKQLSEIVGLIVTAATEAALPGIVGLSTSEAKALLSDIGRNKALIKGALAPLFPTSGDSYANQRRRAEKIYREYFGIEVDFSLVLIPPKPEGNRRLLFNAEGMTCNRAATTYDHVLRAQNREWKLWKWTYDLDGALVQNARTPTTSYAYWVRDGQEPDEEYRNKSTRMADLGGTIGETLLECLIHGVVYFIETKRHLDEKGDTLCTGSREAGGGVPYMRWKQDSLKVFVDWCRVDYLDEMTGLRRVVSL